MSEARCATHPDATVEFFPEGTGTAAAEARAVEFCRSCPVLDQCLDNELLAMRTTGLMGTAGVVGGTTADERRALLRRQPDWTPLRKDAHR